jgi:TolB-like protein
MIKFASCFGLILACTSIAFAQPTTMPGATPQPQLKILVAPFGQVGANNLGWIGKAIDEEISIDVGVDSGMGVVSANNSLVNRDQAMEAGKRAGATLVVFGTYQYYAGQLRVIGEVLDVLNGRTLVMLGGDAPLADLEKTEDAISAQLADALPQQAPPTVAAAGNPSQPVYVYVAPPQNASPYPDTPYPDYATPQYFPYGPVLNDAYSVPSIYGEGWGDVGFFGGGFYGGGGHRGGFHGGGFHGGFHAGGFHAGGFHGGHGR